MSLFKKLALATVTMVVALGIIGVAVPMATMAQTAPVGFEKISGPSQISKYTDVIKFAGSDDLFGRPRSTVAANTVVKTVAQASTASSGTVLGNSTLGNLLILDSIFGGNNVLGGSNGVLGSGSDSLGNLFILNDLFGGSTGSSGSLLGTGTTNGSLSNLLILNSIFGNGSGVLGGNSALSGGGTLGNLIILDKLFGGGM